MIISTHDPIFLRSSHTHFPSCPHICSLPNLISLGLHHPAKSSPSIGLGSSRVGLIHTIGLGYTKVYRMNLYHTYPDPYHPMPANSSHSVGLDSPLDRPT